MADSRVLNVRLVFSMVAEAYHWSRISAEHSIRHVAPRFAIPSEPRGGDCGSIVVQTRATGANAHLPSLDLDTPTFYKLDELVL